MKYSVWCRLFNSLTNMEKVRGFFSSNEIKGCLSNVNTIIAGDYCNVFVIKGFHMTS